MVGGGAGTKGVGALRALRLLPLTLWIAAIDTAVIWPQSRALLQEAGNVSISSKGGSEGNGTGAGGGFAFSQGVGAEAMGIWHGYEDERRCGNAVSVSLALEMAPDGMILAEWSIATHPAPGSGAESSIVDECYTANMTTAFVAYDEASGITMNSITMDLTGVGRWIRSCEGGGDMTDAWQQRVANCTRNIPNCTGPRDPYCSVTGTLNVSLSQDGEAYEVHICVTAWSLRMPGAEHECYLLVHHTAPVPGTYRFASCSACEPAACPAGALTIRDVNPIFCTAGVDWEGRQVLGVPRLDCPENKDRLTVETAGTSLTVHASTYSKLWKQGTCYGELECVSGECTAPPWGPRTCAGGGSVFVVDPVLLPAVGQTTLTVVGTCLNSSGSSSSVHYGPYTCEAPILVSDGMVTCTSVPGVGVGLAITVTAPQGMPMYGSCGPGEGCSVTYTPPTVTYASPSTCPSFGGCLMTIRGANFGVPAQEGVQVQVFVGGEECVMAAENCAQCGHKGDGEIICMVTSSRASPPSPVLVRRYAQAHQTASCGDCESGYEALYINNPGDDPDGCVCAAMGYGASFAYLGASPIVSLTLLGDVAGFDTEDFRRKLAAVLSIGVEQVFLTGIRSGSIIVDLSLLSTVGNSIGHIQALSDLRDRAKDGSLAAAFPNAVNVTVVGDEEEVFEVIAAEPPPTPAPESGIAIMWWQVVIIVMVLGAVLACVGAVWRYSTLPNLGPWGTTASHHSKLPASVGEEEGFDDPDTVDGAVNRSMSAKSTGSGGKNLQADLLKHSASAQKQGSSKNLRQEKSGLASELFL